jgi:pimeloyl-ACP methyl ester carboxylesterase
VICLRHDSSSETFIEGFAPSIATPFYFGPAERRLFGWYYPARSGGERNAGIVLCKPLGYEAICTDASYRYLAERLSEAGYPVLRFDYDGTGDSFGDDEDSDRVQSWKESIGFAIDTLRQRSGREEITLFGVRFGATLAAITASERGDIKNLILWAGFPNGRSYLRERRALHSAHARSETESPSAKPTDYEEAAGFIVTTDTAADLLKVDIAALSRQPAVQALLIDRDDLPGEKRLVERLSALGTKTTRVKWPGYAAMMRDTQDSEVPIFAIDSILVWLEDNTARLSEYPAHAARTFVLENTLLEAKDYTEEPVVRGEDGTLFGILTFPQTKNEHSKTVTLLLSVGANPHIGPNRMYVPLARQLAAQGFPVLRMDVPGVGDSARGATTGRQAIYSASAIADVKAALSDLEALTGAKNFALVGLCSGAYMAFQAAAADPRVRAQVLINPQTFEWQDGDSLEVRMSQSYKQTRLYLNSLNDTNTLKRVVRGQVNVKGIAGALFKRSTKRFSQEMKNVLSLTTRLKPFEAPVCRTFRKIAEQGTDTLLVFAAEDFGIEVTASYIGPNAQRVRGPHKPRIEIIDAADHTFTPKASRETMLTLVADYLNNRFEP